MTTFNTTQAGLYIHCSFYTVPTTQDGEAIIFIAVDNASRYCFAPTPAKHFNITSVKEHLFNVIDELKKIHPEIVPSFIISYGKDFWDELVNQFTPHATLLYLPDEANRITTPVIEYMFEMMNKQTK